MINKSFCVFAFVIITTPLFAQYYYKDIVINKQAIAEMAILKEQKIRSVKINSFESDGQPSEGFFGEKKISKDHSRMEAMTKSYITGPSLFSSFFNNGMLYKTIDSSQISVSTSMYTFNSKNNITTVVSTIRSNDDDFMSEIKEEHIYIYNENGLPEKMIKVKNNKDTTTILFSLDEKNNVAIEKDTKTGSKYFYYYDNQNRLTDIVHSNDFKQRLLPDYLFEYNNKGQVTQMINTEEGGNYYFIWKYLYDNGLRIKEKCFSKEKRLLGTIEYEYK